MKELDLRSIGQLPIMVPRDQIAEYIERIDELRVQLEQHNTVGDLRRNLRQIVRTGTKALDSDDPAVLKAAIGTMLALADRRLRLDGG